MLRGGNKKVNCLLSWVRLSYQAVYTREQNKKKSLDCRSRSIGCGSRCQGAGPQGTGPKAPGLYDPRRSSLAGLKGPGPCNLLTSPGTHGLFHNKGVSFSPTVSLPFLPKPSLVEDIYVVCVCARSEPAPGSAWKRCKVLTCSRAAFISFQLKVRPEL